MWPTGQIGEPIGTSVGGSPRPSDARSRLVKTDRGRPHSGHVVVKFFLPLMGPHQPFGDLPRPRPGRRRTAAAVPFLRRV